MNGLIFIQLVSHRPLLLLTTNIVLLTYLPTSPPRLHILYIGHTHPLLTHITTPPLPPHLRLAIIPSRNHHRRQPTIDLT